MEATMNQTPPVDPSTWTEYHEDSNRLREVEDWEVIGYSIVVPAVCGVGMVANALSLVVLFRGTENLKESLYTYLKVLSAADLVTVTLVCLSGLSRGVWSDSFFWKCFDELFHLPVGSVSSSVSITTLIAVTMERVTIIRAPISFRVYCTPTFARKICLGNFIFSVVFNIPYFLTFTISEGKLVYSKFAKSRYYAVHNWFRLILLGLVPVVTLLLGNLFLLHSLWRPKRPFLAGRSLATTADQRRLTWVLVAMIFSFLLGEFPTHIASRSSAVTLLFLDRLDLLYTTSFRVFKLIVTILMSLHYSINFFLYCALNKRFSQELQRILPLTSRNNCCSKGVIQVAPASVSHQETTPGWNEVAPWATPSPTATSSFRILAGSS